MKTEQTKTIYDLELHENLEIRNSLIVERVPGGWNYKYFTGTLNGDDIEWTIFQIVFVPYNNEFQIVPKCDF